jgi:hypothetical protein
MMSRVPVKATFNDVHIRIWKGLLKKRSRIVFRPHRRAHPILIVGEILSVARWAGENSNYAGM